MLRALDGVRPSLDPEGRMNGRSDFLIRIPFFFWIYKFVGKNRIPQFRTAKKVIENFEKKTDEFSKHQSIIQKKKWQVWNQIFENSTI